MKEEVKVQAGVTGEEDYYDATKKAMIGVKFFVGHPGEMLDWAPGFGGQQVVYRKLRSCHYANPFGEMKIVVACI